jgi:hypothetical protein
VTQAQLDQITLEAQTSANNDPIEWQPWDGGESTSIAFAKSFFGNIYHRSGGAMTAGVGLLEFTGGAALAATGGFITVLLPGVGIATIPAVAVGGGIAIHGLDVFGTGMRQLLGNPDAQPITTTVTQQLGGQSAVEAMDLQLMAVDMMTISHVGSNFAPRTTPNCFPGGTQVVVATDASRNVVDIAAVDSPTLGFAADWNGDKYLAAGAFLTGAALTIRRKGKTVDRRRRFRWFGRARFVSRMGIPARPNSSEPSHLKVGQECPTNICRETQRSSAEFP